MIRSSSRPRIYLAGPDVFVPDSPVRFRALMTACARHGLQGVAPSDGDIPQNFEGDDDARALRIYEGNVLRIQQCDAVLANLCDFRGLEPDSGTVFEVGFAVALGKPVAAYGIPPGSYAQRVARQLPCTADHDGQWRETATGMMVEGLGQPVNLMLARSTAVCASMDAALAHLAALLSAPDAEDGLRAPAHR